MGFKPATYDSANRLITVDTRYYVYDVEGTRINTQRGEDVTQFVYNVNARLSQLLVKTENNAKKSSITNIPTGAIRLVYFKAIYS